VVSERLTGGVRGIVFRGIIGITLTVSVLRGIIGVILRGSVFRGYYACSVERVEPSGIHNPGITHGYRRRTGHGMQQGFRG